MNKTLLFIKLRFTNGLGLNEIKYGHNKKQNRKKIRDLILYFILGVIVAFFIGGIYGSLDAIGQHALIPLFQCIAGSAVVLVADIFAAGSAIFNPATYEREIVLPVHPASIVISRIAGLYLINIILMLIIFLPACILFSSASAWILGITGILFTPLIPMAVSLALGAFVSAIASHVKHKSAISSALSIILSIAVFIFIFLRKSDTMLVEDIAGIFSGISAQICQWYPPAAWFASGDLLFTALFAVVSFAVCALFVWIASRKFAPICSAMNTHYAKKNYQMTNLSSSTQLKSLYKMELKRYFSSSAYVTNTIVSYIMAVIIAVILCVLGSDTIADLTGSDTLFKLGAFAIALFAVLSPVSQSAISIEGKHWWIKQTLPVPAKKIMQAKLLVNYTVSLPFILAASVIYCFAAEADAGILFGSILIPLVCALFSGVLGLYENLKHPNLSWDMEINAVKRGPAITRTMLFGALAVVALYVISVFAGIAAGAVIGLVALLVVSLLLYRKCLSFELNALEEA